MRPPSSTIAVFATGAWLLTACVSTQRLSGTALGSLAAEITGQIQTRYVEPFKSGDVDRWVQVFADDALAYHDGPPPFKGRDAIAAFGRLVHKNFRIDQFDVTVDEVRAQGSWALTAGHYTATFVPKTSDAYAPAAGPRQGKFVFLWERQNGIWRIITDMGNSTDPPPGERR